MLRTLPTLLCIVCLSVGIASSQQTVFNVPSADVLDCGKVYAELDLTAQPVLGDGTFTPRIVYGMGHDVEIGLNVGSFGVPEVGTVTLTPVLKWKFAYFKSVGVALYGGEHLFVPVYKRSYHAGSYTYLAAEKTFRNTRFTLGAYDFTAHVIDAGSRSGLQAALEYNISPRLTAAADWFSGNNSVGYVTPGVVYKISKQLTGYASYQIGNAGIHNGNHGFLFELGWNPN